MVDAKTALEKLSKDLMKIAALVTGDPKNSAAVWSVCIYFLIKKIFVHFVVSCSMFNNSLGTQLFMLNTFLGSMAFNGQAKETISH